MRKIHLSNLSGVWSNRDSHHTNLCKTICSNGQHSEKQRMRYMNLQFWGGWRVYNPTTSTLTHECCVPQQNSSVWAWSIRQKKLQPGIRLVGQLFSCSVTICISGTCTGNPVVHFSNRMLWLHNVVIITELPPIVTWVNNNIYSRGTTLRELANCRISLKTHYVYAIANHRCMTSVHSHWAYR